MALLDARRSCLALEQVLGFPRYRRRNLCRLGHLLSLSSMKNLDQSSLVVWGRFQTYQVMRSNSSSLLRQASPTLGLLGGQGLHPNVVVDQRAHVSATHVPAMCANLA